MSQRPDAYRDLPIDRINIALEENSGLVACELKGAKPQGGGPLHQRCCNRRDRRDLRLRVREIDPVILVVYDAGKDRAFCLYVQPYLGQRSSRDLFGDYKSAVAVAIGVVAGVLILPLVRRLRSAARGLEIETSPSVSIPFYGTVTFKLLLLLLDLMLPSCGSRTQIVVALNQGPLD